MKTRTTTCYINGGLKEFNKTDIYSPEKDEDKHPFPCLVQDTDEGNKDIKNWRTIQMIEQDRSVQSLWASASAAPSKNDFSQISDNIHRITDKSVKKIIILDLREESHGYLNGQAINYMMPDNWGNLDKDHNKIVEEEDTWLKSLSQQDTLTNVISIQQLKKNNFTYAKPISVCSIQSEQEIVEGLGLCYYRLTVTDHRAPRVEDIERFVKLIENMEDQCWLHIHCRGGAGRSTTFLAMYAMLKYANETSFDTIIKQQASIPPLYNLALGSLTKQKYAKYYQMRYEFLSDFYQYAKERLNGYPEKWSKWLENRKTCEVALSDEDVRNTQLQRFKL